MATGAAVASPDFIRTLAHELRQPLSTIESIAYYLTLILPEDEKVREQLERIQMLVEQSNWMLNSAQLMSDGCRGALESIALDAIIPGCNVAIQGDLALRGAIESLAMLHRQFASPHFFRATECDGEILLEMEAGGATFPGAALSLDGARRVIEARGGSLDVQIDPAGIRLTATIAGAMLT
jgi:hypothetical protein